MLVLMKHLGELDHAELMMRIIELRLGKVKIHDALKQTHVGVTPWMLKRKHLLKDRCTILDDCFLNKFVSKL